MISRAKYEKAVDEAFAMHVVTAFNVLMQGINGARPETKDVAVKAFSNSMNVAIEAHGIAMAAAPEAPPPKK